MFINVITLDVNFWLKVSLAVFIIIYGLVIIILGFKSHYLIQYIAKIKVVSYFIIIFTPLYYAGIELNFSYVLGVFLFFPLFYALIYLIDRFVPDPKAFIDDLKDSSDSSNFESKSLGALK